MNEEVDSDATIEGDELFDSNVPTTSAANTKKQYRWVEGLWEKWIESLFDVEPEMFKCDLKMLLMNFPAMINDYCSKFFAEIRNKEGQVYPPKTLNYMFRLMAAIAKENGCDYNLLVDTQFARVRCYLDNQMKTLTKKGMQKQVRKAEVVTEEMEMELYNLGILGDHCPETLLRTVYFVVGKFFALRARE